LQEITAERNLSIGHVTIWRRVQRYAPELNRCRPELRNTNRSWRVDETYCKVAGKWTYLYRVVDTTGATIDFLLSAKRDAVAAKRFLQKALRSPGHPRPRTGEFGRHCRCRPVQYLNNIIEQDLQSYKTEIPSLSGLPILRCGAAKDSRNGNDEHDM
jgi:transposase-like protein